MESAQNLLLAGQVYVWIGLAVAAVFLLWGLDRIDSKGHGSWMFRPLLVPGVTLLWPLVLYRWNVLERAREDLQKRHAPPLTGQRILGTGLAVLIPVIVVGALLVRQDGPWEREAVMLAPPTETAADE